jgi:hypothetical protein
VVEQTLNLTQEEKINLYNALCINYMPENRVYRYNFIYSNCTTKARDIIENCINGKLTYTSPETSESLRSLLHKCSAGFPWIEFSNDLCLGASADVTTDSCTR